jgi:hypothetical protein
VLGHCLRDQCPADIGSHNWFGSLDVSDVDAVHAELIGRGTTSAAPIDQSYGIREILVITIDGHRIVVGQQHR